MIKKVILSLVVLGAISGVAVYKYMNKSHVNVETVDAEFTISAADMIQKFTEDETAAGQTYVDKLVEVSGPFVSSETSSGGQTIVYLINDDGFEPGISAAIDSLFYQNNQDLINQLTPNQIVTVKGVCSGSLMGVVQLSRSILVQE